MLELHLRISKRSHTIAVSCYSRIPAETAKFHTRLHLFTCTLIITTADSRNFLLASLITLNRVALLSPVPTGDGSVSSPSNWRPSGVGHTVLDASQSTTQVRIKRVTLEGVTNVAVSGYQP